jgi:histidyl-tRNA synthetase
MKKTKFQIPTGMHDILPVDQGYFKKIYDTVEDVANFYGFGKIDTPIVEMAELFSRGIGLTTDIVEKEMYVLKTKGEDILALRPEGTAPVARAFIEHGMHTLPQPVKLWYFGPYFRYEKPQADRYRQFWQFGFEIFGEKSPAVEAQIIQAFYDILTELKFKDLVIEINSIGDSQCRPYYKKLLVSYLRSRESSLCTDCRRRIKTNPLRVLDCKEDKCQRIKNQAPQIIDHLCEECHNHFKEVLEFLDEMSLPYRLNPYLVRGLDYYTKTVFEIFSSQKPEVDKDDLSKGEEAGEEKITKNALVGGGRYDVLVKLLGGKDTPACGGAAGIERIVKMMKAKDIKLPQPSKPVIFLAQIGVSAKRKSLKLFEEFRKVGISAAESFSKDSLKAQLRIADKMGVNYILIIGQKETLEGTVIIRDMKTGKQETVKAEKIVEEVKKRLKK